MKYKEAFSENNWESEGTLQRHGGVLKCFGRQQERDREAKSEGH